MQRIAEQVDLVAGVIAAGAVIVGILGHGKKISKWQGAPV